MRVPSWLIRAAEARAGHPAVNDTTYGELLARARVGAGELRRRGVRTGDAVAIALPPSADFAAALHATWMAGAVAVPHDLRLAEHERPGADHVVDEPLAAEGDAPGDLVAEHDLGALAVVLQTSGTTGPGKRVELTFGNFLWNALGGAAALGHTPADRYLCALPVAHVGGLTILVRAAIAGTTALVHPGWDTERVLHALMEEEVTGISVVSTTLSRLLEAGLSRPPALRYAMAGGGPVPPALVARARRAGVPVAQTYGLTEACSTVTTARPGDVEDDAGPPLFCVGVRIDDGEIVVGGPTVAGGGELRTGDLGRLDRDGRLTVTGRKADTIVTGGENVAPTEVEAVLAAHPAVAEAAVHGRPHPEWGEAVVATVILREGAHATEAELRAHCAAALAGFKVPKEIGFTRALPRTRSGKLLRRALR